MTGRPRGLRLLGELDPDFGFDGERLLGLEISLPGAPFPPEARGAFATVRGDGSGAWRLTRDPLGINKLFFGPGASGDVLVAARPRTLLEAGCPFSEVRAVPAGVVIDLAPDSPARVGSLVPEGWFGGEAGEPSLRRVGGAIRAKLDAYLAALAEAYPGARAYVCLSGGLDSTGVAVLTRDHFPDATAVSFDLRGTSAAPSEDRRVAERLAADLGMPLLRADASENELFELLDTVLLEGLDWRDFNVHTGLVNAVLARAIKEDAGGSEALVFTGDLANEFLADYEPEFYRGRTYYRLPRLPALGLRDSLVRGLDTCHREVGVFGAWGLPVVQPYAVAVDEYLRLGDTFLASEGRKERLCREVFGEAVPEYVFRRKKVRAQAGNPDLGGGVLAASVDRGYGGGRLGERFAGLHGVEPAALARFMRAGRYNSAVPTLEEGG